MSLRKNSVGPKSFFIITLLQISFVFIFLCLYVFIKNENKGIEEPINQNENVNSKIQITNSKKEEIWLYVEIADTNDERAYGLMNRASLPENQGMLFIFDNEQIQTFWMKDTYIPLDMIFIDAAGKIVNIEKDTKPLQTSPTYSSIYPVKFVLEVNGGWSKDNGIILGNHVEIKADVSTESP